jgi:hypothetical protein
LLEGLSAGSNGFEHGAFADLVTQAGRFEVFDNRLLSDLLLYFVDGKLLGDKSDLEIV